MDKNAIKKYAVWARRELIERVSQRALVYGITAKDAGDPNAESVNGHLLSQAEKRQRQALIRNIKEKGYEQVMEEVAYTWFNRFAALRFMEVNGYLPSHIRVFTNDAGEFKPQILAEAIHLELDGLDMNKVYELESANKSEELFKYLLIVQCNALNSILPGMFQRIEDYTELLLPDYLLREGSVIEQMVTTIPEEDWTDQVQIIGWLYEGYNTELNDVVYDGSMSKSRIGKELLPAATTIYTPDWPVRYMVENSLGHLWLEGHPNDTLKSEWKYYLDEAEQEPEVQSQLDAIRKGYATLKPEEIRVIDPCMGSGHILCVLFDVLVRIYEDYGHTAREAAVKIVENNLWGLDIDERAAQLSYFAVMMKARQYDRRFFTRKVQPHVYAIYETNSLKDIYKQVMGDFHLPNNHQETLGYLMDAFVDAKEYGSILQLERRDYNGLKEAWDNACSQNTEGTTLTLWYFAVAPALTHLIEQAIAMTQRYDVVVTNPPYLGSSRFSTKLDTYVKDHYPDVKADLSMVMYRHAIDDLARETGFVAFITTSSWMFLSSFEKLRVYQQGVSSIRSIIDFGTELFEGKVGHNPIVSWVIAKQRIPHYTLSAVRLVDFCYSRRDEKEPEFFNEKNRYSSQQDDFENIPGLPMAYWVSKGVVDTFKGKKVSDYGSANNGFTTGDNNLFLRFWYEVDKNNTCYSAHSIEESVESGCRWFPYNKGGAFRKWYGNNDYVINWYMDGMDIKNYGHLVPRSMKYQFRKSISWSKISSSVASFKVKQEGTMFDVAGLSLFPNEDKYYYYLLALCNSCYAQHCLDFLSPTLNYETGHISSIPVRIDHDRTAEIEEFVKENISISRCDWDSFETSWEYKEHPFITSVRRESRNGKAITIKQAFEDWKVVTEDRFRKLKANEEELNRIFIDIYGLSGELIPAVEERDVSVRRADLQREVRSFISYAVGCMFGRYSLDVEGLVYAGGDFDTKYCRWIRQFGDQASEEIDENGRLVHGGWAGSSLGEYDGVRKDGKWVASSYPPDTDNIIPICDDEYFEDDIVGRFVKFVETVYGTDTLDENLKFIADALGGSGQPKDVIRTYFLNGFYADHLKVYQKRPIYWLFDSGKKNGFKCLIYMHRYQPDTIARIRTDYVHEQQSRYRTAIADLEQRINGASTSERVKLSKQLAKLQAQAEEVRVYEEKIHHLADQMIKIDLDDGVKVNYAKFQDVLAKIK